MKRLILLLVILGAYIAYQQPSLQEQTPEDTPRENFGAIKHFDLPDLITIDPLVYSPQSLIQFTVQDFDGNDITLPTGWQLKLSQTKDQIPSQSLAEITNQNTTFSFQAPDAPGLYFIQIITPSNQIEYQVQIAIMQS